MNHFSPPPRTSLKPPESQLLSLPLRARRDSCTVGYEGCGLFGGPYTGSADVGGGRGRCVCGVTLCCNEGCTCLSCDCALWLCPLAFMGRGCETAFSDALVFEVCGFVGCDVQTVCVDVEAAAAEVVDNEATDFGSGWGVCDRKAARKLLRNGLWVGIVRDLAGPAGVCGSLRGSTLQISSLRQTLVRRACWSCLVLCNDLLFVAADECCEILLSSKWVVSFELSIQVRRMSTFVVREDDSDGWRSENLGHRQLGCREY